MPHLRPAAACAALATLAVAAPASAINYVPSQNGASWGIHDAAAPGLDTGSVRTITDSALLGFAGMKVRVADVPASDPSSIVNGALQRGFGLRYDGLETFRTTSAPVVGGVRMSRQVKVERSANWGRWFDSFTNVTSTPKTVEVSFGGATGQNTTSGSGASLVNNQSAVTDSSSGDAVAGADDAWVLRSNAASSAGPARNGPSAVVLGSPTPFAGAIVGIGDHQRGPFTTPLPPSGHNANFPGYRHAITLAPGQTRSLLRFVSVGRAETTATAGQQIAAVRGEAQALAAAPDTSGLADGELCTIANFDLTALPAFDEAQCAAAAPPEAPVTTTPRRPATTARYDVVGKSLTELQADMEAGRTTSQEITRAYLDRIAAYDVGPFGFRSYISVADDAMAQAQAADEARAGGRRGALLGIPVAVKDLFDTKDQATTNGSAAFEGWRPRRDAFQVARLRAAGAVLLGKANLSEYANSGGQSESAFGQVWNAWDVSKTSLGSSGGSAVATATSMAAFGMGSQTGVSLYAPATGAGLVTMRGTDGISSLAGAMPLSLYQDFLGPIARSVRDVAAILNATTGTDPEDPVTVRADADAKRPADWTTALDRDALQGKRIGYVAAAFGSTYGDTAVIDAVRARFATLEAAGATMVEIPAPPGTASPTPATVNSRAIEGWQQYLDRQVDPPYRNGAEPLNSQRLLPYNRRQTPVVGNRLTQPEIDAILAARDESKRRVKVWMDEQGVDAVVYPGFRSDVYDNDGATLTSDRNSGVITSNYGVPTVVVPVGLSPQGQPMSLQIVGRAFEDAKVLGFGYALEQRLALPPAVPATAPRLAYDPSATPREVSVPTPPAPITQAPAPEPSSNAAPGTGTGTTAPSGAPSASRAASLSLVLPPVARVRSGVVRLRLRNAGGLGVSSTVVLRARLRVSGRVRAVTLGSARVRLGARRSGVVTVRLGPTARRALRGRSAVTLEAAASAPLRRLSGGAVQRTVLRRVVLVLR